MTFDADYHFFCFLICFSAGVIARAVTFPAEILSRAVKNRVLSAACIFFTAIFCAAAFIFVKNFYVFPPLRGYMIVVFSLGFWLMQKIYAKKIAFIAVKLYNKVENLRKRREYLREFRKIKKGSGFGNGGGGSASRHSYFGDDLSDGVVKPKKRAKSRTRTGNNSVAKGKGANHRQHRPLAVRLENKGKGVKARV